MLLNRVASKKQSGSIARFSSKSFIKPFRSKQIIHNKEETVYFYTLVWKTDLNKK